jgi:1,4-dihydroxy-6-naphthoate synthase
LPPDVQQSFSAALKASVLFAQRNPQSSAGFVRRHAQISDDTVIARHIGLFVNEYTVALGEEGRRAAEFFLAETLRLGFVDRLPEQIFAC